MPNVFRVTGPCLNLMVKPSIYGDGGDLESISFMFFKRYLYRKDLLKKYKFMHFERKNAFQMHKTLFFARKK